MRLATLVRQIMCWRLSKTTFDDVVIRARRCSTFISIPRMTCHVIRGYSAYDYTCSAVVNRIVVGISITIR